MKKNISINISGIIFHIEEDGYEELKKYLDSINKYFSSFDENDEIISDIESRIAEIFLSKLNEGKQIITESDVKNLVVTMGSVEDFQAVEEDHHDAGKEGRKNYDNDIFGSKKLFRDPKRKLLGGVSAGIAHYFGIDPLWIRLIIFLLSIGTAGIIIIAYIILWVALPESLDLEEDKQLKKMYRNPEGKVLGGVASGLAAYFGVDTAVVRLLFVISIFLGGTGIIAYIILWLILPEANTITEKVQMQGDPVTLSNIESSIKRSLNVEGKDENLFLKVLLFPFRLIAVLIHAISTALGPILLFMVEALRVVAGVFLFITGLGLMFSVIVSFAVLLGMITGNSILFPELAFPLELFDNSFPISGLIGAALFVGVPAVALVILGVTIISKNKIVNATLGWSLFAVWIVSIIILAFIVPAIILNFKEEGIHTVTKTYQVDGKAAVLSLRETGLEDYQVTSLRLRGHESNEYKLVQTFESRGKSRRDAINNAKMTQYNVTLEDSVFTFDSNVSFKKNAIFRGQDLDMTLYIPYNAPFYMNDDLKYILRNTIYKYGYTANQISENKWIFTPAGLECTTCEREYYRYESNKKTYKNTYTRKFDVQGFTDIEVKNAFKVEIYQGDQFKVTALGREEDIDEVSVETDGDKLIISYTNDRFDPNRRKRAEVTVKILMPTLQNLELSGISNAYVRDFEEERMSIRLSEAAKAEAYIDAKEIDIELRDHTFLEIKGEGSELNADIEGSSELHAYSYKVSNADVESNGAGEAQLYVTDNLNVDANFVSKIKYRGGAKINNDQNDYNNVEEQ